MPRKKSLQDIINQRERILNSARGARRDVARAIADRYTANIRASKSYQRDYNDFWSPLNDRERAYAGDIVTTRKYSQRTYMGLANG